MRSSSTLMLKPMNCPHHIKIFASQPHSYPIFPCASRIRHRLSLEQSANSRIPEYAVHSKTTPTFSAPKTRSEKRSPLSSLVKIVLTTPV